MIPTRGTMKAAAAVVCLMAVIAAVTVIRLDGGVGPAVAAKSARHIGEVRVPAMGITFIPAANPTAAQPSLPDGRPAVSRSSAVTEAMARTVGARDGELLPRVRMTARFGTYWDDQLGRKPSTGGRPAYQNQPVWFVTFSGPGVMIQTSAPSPMRPNVPYRFMHEENVVVDGATDQVLETYSFSRN